MIRLSLTLYLYIMFTQTIFSQSMPSNKKGAYEIQFSLNLLPVNQRKADISFLYVDGNANANYPIDTIRASYALKQKIFNFGFTLGGSYYVTNKIKVFLTATPHFNSFVSNKSKNGRTYGVQFDLGMDYIQPISTKLSVMGGVSVTRIIGGYGITSGGANRKDYLVVNGNKLYDNDIGFHIIDNSWATTLQTGIEYGSGSGKYFFKVGYQIPFHRTSRMNFAGELEDESVKWNRKSFDDADVTLSVDQQRITSGNINSLPYLYSGLMFQIGIVSHFKHK
jgi:hypothetical protein